MQVSYQLSRQVKDCSLVVDSIRLKWRDQANILVPCILKKIASLVVKLPFALEKYYGNITTSIWENNKPANIQAKLKPTKKKTFESQTHIFSHT